MFDLVIESIAIYHLPITILLGICVLFWSGVIIGALDLDVFDFDLDIDGDIDLDADADVDSGGESAFSALGVALKFVNIHKVPTMVVLTIFALSMWTLALFLNAAFNPGEIFHRSLPIATGLLIPNFMASVFITKLVTKPLGGVFDKLNHAGEVHVPVVGRSGRIKTASVSDSFGQVEVLSDGAPVLIEARVAADSETLTKGTEVIVVEHDSESGIYIVRSL